MARPNINIGIKIAEISKVQEQLQKQLDSIGKKVKINISNVDISNIDSQLATLNKKLASLSKQVKISPKVDTGSISKSVGEYDKLANAIGKVNERSQTKRAGADDKWSLKNAQAYNKALDEQYSKQIKLSELTSNLQAKLNQSFDNRMDLGFDTEQLTILQNKLNQLNTNTPEAEIKALKSEINSLATTDSKVNKLQTTVDKLGNSLSKIKTTKKVELMSTEELAQLKQAESDMGRLVRLQEALENGGSVSMTQIANATRTAERSMSRFGDTVQRTVTESRGLSGMARTFREIAGYAIGGSVIYAGINQIRESISYIKELDQAMINLKKVSEETDNTYNKFLGKAHDIAMEYGSQSDKVVEATTSWKKTGESLENATELAKNTMVLSKVGDIGDVATAQQFMIAPLKAFNIEAGKSIELVDKYNKIANNMATDVPDLGEGLSRSASSLATAGNDLNQSLALLATAEANTKLGGDTIGNA